MSKGKLIEIIRGVPIAEYQSYAEYVEALAEELQNSEFGIRNAELRVAREIFAEIEKLSYRFMNDKHYIFGDMVWDINELKKKYTEGEK